MTDEINLFALHFVGGRLNPEPSRAREARYYGRRGDPANHIEFPSERDRREQARREEKSKRKGK